MKLTPTEVRAAHYAVAWCVRALDGRPVPPSVAALAARLDTVLRTGEAVVPPTRHQTGCGATQSEIVEWVGSKMAAEILGWDIRRVQRAARRGDLEGQMIGHRYAFPAHAIAAYAALRREEDNG